MYTITLKDGTKLENLDMNGNNYVSKTEIDTTIFTNDNLSKIVVSDGETETTYENMKFIQQTKYSDGYYFILAEMTERDKMLKAMEENSQSINDILVAILGGK